LNSANELTGVRVIRINQAGVDKILVSIKTQVGFVFLNSMAFETVSLQYWKDFVREMCSGVRGHFVGLVTSESTRS
jgi:hypothetical protein